MTRETMTAEELIARLQQLPRHAWVYIDIGTRTVGIKPHMFTEYSDDHQQTQRLEISVPPSERASQPVRTPMP